MPNMYREEVEAINDRAPEGDRSYAALKDRLDMGLQNAMLTQRAVRKVLPDPVDDEIIRRCIELSLKAPTGSNGQNWEFIVVKDVATKAVLATQYRRAWRLYGGIGHRLNAGKPDMLKVLRAVEWQVENFEMIPVIVIPCLRKGRLPVLPLPRIGESSYFGSIYPSVQNLLLAARAFGLGASLITLPLWNTFVVRKALGLPVGVAPVCAVPMGWPQGKYGPTSRRPVDEVLHFEKYGNHTE